MRIFNKLRSNRITVGLLSVRLYQINLHPRITIVQYLLIINVLAVRIVFINYKRVLVVNGRNQTEVR